MNIHQPQLAWFLWSLLLLIIWCVLYSLLQNKESRKQMLAVSLWTSLLGITEPLFVPAYWFPPSLFDLAHLTGFDIESFIFSFGIGGITVILYNRIFGVISAKIDKSSEIGTLTTSKQNHRFHLLAILSAPIVFIVLFFTTSLNPIYVSSIALIFGGLATWYCRPDLMKKMSTSALLFLALYFVFFLALIATYPGYVEQVWNLKVISGILVAGIPLEELLFAFSFGFFWSSVYEHFMKSKITNKN